MYLLNYSTSVMHKYLLAYLLILLCLQIKIYIFKINKPICLHSYAMLYESWYGFETLNLSPLFSLTQSLEGWWMEGFIKEINKEYLH